MAAILLDTTDANRNHIFWLTIRDAGFECPEVNAARAVFRTGSAWRAHCGGVLTYWVDVDEFARLSITPIPYGDFEGSIDRNAVEPRILLRDQEGRTLELQDQR